MLDTDTYVQMDKELEPRPGEGLFKCENGVDTCKLCGKAYAHRTYEPNEMKLLEEMYDHMLQEHYDWHIMWRLAYDKSQ